MPNVSVTPSRPIKNPVRGGRDLNFILRNQGFRTGGVLLSPLLPHLLVTLWHVPDLPPPCPIRWPDFRISSLQQKVPPATRLFQTFHNPCKAFTERCLWTVGSQNRVIFEFSKLRANTTVFEKENISWNVQIRNSLKSIFLLPSKENYQAQKCAWIDEREEWWVLKAPFTWLWKCFSTSHSIQRLQITVSQRF